MKIERRIFDEIASTVGSFEPETGGVLGMKDGVVCAFYFDRCSDHRMDEYRPNTENINSKLAEWATDGIAFAGIVHSHPNNCPWLSRGDHEGISTIVRAIHSFETLYFPIVTVSDVGFSMSVYRVSGSSDNICIDETSYELVK